MRQRRWVAVALVTGLAIFITEGALAFAVNAAGSVDSRWPLGLETVRGHPFRWSLILLAVVVLLGLLVAWMVAREPAPPAGEPAVPAPDPEMFRRERALAQLEGAVPWTRETVVEQVTAELRIDGPPVVLVGLKGSGKTPLVRDVVDRADQFEHALVVSFDGPAGMQPGYLATRLNAYLRAVGRGFDADVLRRTPVETALSELAAALGDLPVLLVLERLDRLGSKLWPQVLNALAGMPRARAIITARRRPPSRGSAVIVPVKALSEEEASGLAVSAVGYLRLSVDVADVLKAMPAAVLGHPRSLLHCLVDVDRLPASVARSRVAHARPESKSSSTVRELIRKLPDGDRAILYQLLPVDGASAEDLFGWLPSMGDLAADSVGAELLRSSLADSLTPRIRIPEIVREAAMEEAGKAISDAAATTVRLIVEPAPQYAARTEAVAPTVAYRLRQMGLDKLVLVLCGDRALLDRLNRTGRWDDYLTLLRIGALTAEASAKSELAAEFLLRMAGKLPERGDVAGGEEALERARLLVEALDDRQLRARWESLRGLIELYRNRPGPARIRYERALELSDDPNIQCVCNKQLGHVLEMLGDSARALEHYRTAAGVGDPGNRHTLEARIDIALSLSRSEPLDPAVKQITKVIEDVRALPEVYPTVLSRALLAYALIVRRQHKNDRAMQAVRDALALTDTDPRHRFLAEELLRRWTPPHWYTPGSLLAQLPRPVRRAVLVRRTNRRKPELAAAVAEYQADVRQLYAWDDRAIVDFSQRVEQAANLRRRLATFALGTGADQEDAASVFHDTDTRTIELISG